MYIMYVFIYLTYFMQFMKICWDHTDCFTKNINMYLNVLRVFVFRVRTTAFVKKLDTTLEDDWIY